MAFAFARHRFFGREVVNFAVTLPIILPGVITGVALASFFLFTRTDLSTQHRDHRPHDVLHRARLQQRAGAAAAAVALDRGGIARPRRERLADVPLRDASRRSARRSSRARCCRWRCRSTRSPSRSSSPARTPRRCRSGSWARSATARAVPEVNAAATVILLISLPMIALAGLPDARGGRRGAASGRSKPPVGSGGRLAVVLRQELRPGRRVLAFGAAQDRLVRGRGLARGRPAGALCRETCNLDKACGTRLAAAFMRPADTSSIHLAYRDQFGLGYAI